MIFRFHFLLCIPCFCFSLARIPCLCLLIHFFLLLLLRSLTFLLHHSLSCLIIGFTTYVLTALALFFSKKLFLWLCKVFPFHIFFHFISFFTYRRVKVFKFINLFYLFVNSHPVSFSICSNYQYLRFSLFTFVLWFSNFTWNVITFPCRSYSNFITTTMSAYARSGIRTNWSIRTTCSSNYTWSYCHNASNCASDYCENIEKTLCERMKLWNLYSKLKSVMRNIKIEAKLICWEETQKWKR